MLTVGQKRLAIVVGAVTIAAQPHIDQELVAEEIHRAILPSPGQPWDRSEALAVTFQWWDEIQALEERLFDLICDTLKAEEEAGIKQILGE